MILSGVDPGFLGRVSHIQRCAGRFADFFLKYSMKLK